MGKIKRFFGRAFSKMNTMSVEKENSSNVAVKSFYGTLGAATAVAAATPGVFALSNLMSTVKKGLEDLFKALADISMPAVGVVTIGCLLTRVLAKNPRTVEMATEWLKRAWIAFFCINIIHLILDYIKELAGGKGKPTVPSW